ncbi:MAG: Glutamate-ammonia-ligase adenylyltransferase, partial [Pseudomonadota bacterium]
MTAAGPFETGDDMDSKRPPPLSEGSRFYQRLQRR